MYLWYAVNPQCRRYTLSTLTCWVGASEYTTGFVGEGMSGSDKKFGVVGLTLFDL